VKGEFHLILEIKILMFVEIVGWENCIEGWRKLKLCWSGEDGVKLYNTQLNLKFSTTLHFIRKQKNSRSIQLKNFLSKNPP
jgi:hypothetical protein